MSGTRHSCRGGSQTRPADASTMFTRRVRVDAGGGFETRPYKSGENAR
jgi:hypothetical protein